VKKATLSLTVITPVFNGANYIEETVNSILALAPNAGFEYIVVNDGSTDETLAILKSYGARIQLISQPNSGESSAVNTGLSAAQGEYILVISADDPLFTSEIFEGVQDFFEANPEVSAWYPDWQMINEHGDLINVVKPKEYSIENLVGRAICLPGPGTFFRRDMAIEIGGRREKWKYVADYDFWLRLSDLGPLRKRNEIVAQWRHHKDSTTSAKAGISMFSERINVIDEFLKTRNIRGKLSRMARANTRYHASTIKFNSNSIPARRTILKAFIIRRRWLEEMTFIAFCQLLVSTKVLRFLETINFHPKQFVRRFLRLLVNWSRR
jgi:glycosyltransferase involved in cell wall biosynthesis